MESVLEVRRGHESPARRVRSWLPADLVAIRLWRALRLPRQAARVGTRGRSTGLAGLSFRLAACAYSFHPAGLEPLCWPVSALGFGRLRFGLLGLGDGLG